MLKFGFTIKEVGSTLNINLIDPTEKQLNSATENEKIVAQSLKDLFEKRLLKLLEEDKKENKKENN